MADIKHKILHQGQRLCLVMVVLAAAVVNVVIGNIQGMSTVVKIISFLYRLCSNDY